MTSFIPPLRGPATAFLGLGSNLGDSLAILEDCVHRVHGDERTRVVDVSSVYRTTPVGRPEQDDYLNLVVRVETRRSPRSLLALAQKVEQVHGRTRELRWGPRTLDVDLLLFAGRIVRSRRLRIPHPRLTERAFALVPLMEVAPGWHLPDGTSLASRVAALAPIEGVEPIGRQVQVPT